MPKQRPSAIRLDPARVAAWRLARQRLGGPPAADPVEVARDLVGVQAQVMSSAALSVALRTNGSLEDAPSALLEHRLVRMWGHRGTLHLFAADDVPTLVAASIPSEPWRRPAWLRWFGVTERQMEQAIEAVGELLDDGVPRTRAELADAMRSTHGEQFATLVGGSWGSFLKLAGDKGYVVHAWTGDATVRFTRPDRWLGSWRVEDPGEATRSLVLRYLAAYGPASVDEVARWWGGGQVRPVMKSLGPELTAVEVGGERGFVLTQDLAAIEASELPPADEGVRLLGPFDPLTVGAGLRRHLLPPVHLKRVSRTAGWISPVLLLDGVVAGVWTSERGANRLQVTVDPFGPLTAATKRRVASEVARIGAIHGLGAELSYGPVFETVDKRSRTNGNRGGGGVASA